MKIHQLPVAEVLASVRSAAGGLASADAAARLAEYGPNRIEPLARAHWSWRLAREFTQLFSIILWIAAGLAFLAQWFDPAQQMGRVGVAVVLVILLSGLFSFWQEARIERTLAALQRLLPPHAQVLRDGGVRTLAAEALVPGDLILLQAGDNVPADCRLIEALGMRVNRSTVTGESRPQTCDAGPSTVERHFDSRNVVLAGTSVIAGHGRAVVFATGAQTEFGRIAHLAQASGAGESPLRREIARLSRTIALLALGIGVFFFVLGSFTGVPFWRDAVLSLAIIVALVPEGLQPTLTLSLVLAAQRLARRNVLIRHLPAVETLGSVTVICTDKTGTLTENRMRVSHLYLDLQTIDLQTFDLEAPGAAAQLVARHPLFFRVARYCQGLAETGHAGQPAFEGDPLEVALVEMSRRFVELPAAAARLDELPFDSERMRQSVIYPEPAGPMLYCKGAVEVVLPLCRSIALAADERPLGATMRDVILRAQEQMASEGLRVIALAARRLPAPYSAQCPAAARASRSSWSPATTPGRRSRWRARSAWSAATMSRSSLASAC